MDWLTFSMDCAVVALMMHFLILCRSKCQRKSSQVSKLKNAKLLKNGVECVEFM